MLHGKGTWQVGLNQGSRVEIILDYLVSSKESKVKDGEVRHER